MSETLTSLPGIVDSPQNDAEVLGVVTDLSNPMDPRSDSLGFRAAPEPLTLAEQQRSENIRLFEEFLNIIF